MTRYLKLFVCLTASLTAAALAQTTDQPEATKTSSPVAFVYVSSPTGIDAFAASSTGRLTPVPGSPFPGAVNSMSVNKKYLFGAGDNGIDIFTFSIGSNGALRQVGEINAQKYSDYCGEPQTDSFSLAPLQIDYTGTTLYDQTCVLQSFKIEDNGELQFLGSADFGIPTGVSEGGTPLIFLGTNKYAYQTGCQFNGGADPNLPATFLYERVSNGALEAAGAVATNQPANNYCPENLAGDPTNHLAIAFQDILGDEMLGPTVIASYTADSHGNLTTTNTFAKMPQDGIVNAMSISPSGKLLAAASGNFQVFHFNGAEPITPFTGVLQASFDYGFIAFGWDGDNHLYALSVGSSNYQLRVYTVTPTSFTEDPGSPLTVPGSASSLIVRSLN
jgi:hypothetical protein